jgi:hypothetical protein
LDRVWDSAAGRNWEARVTDAAAILTAYRDDHVMDRRTSRTPLRRSSEESVFEIFEAGSWRSEEGFANVEYVVGLDSPAGTLHLQFVSVENGAVTLWGDEYGET